jgi:phenylacetate-CoA ligase
MFAFHALSEALGQYFNARLSRPQLEALQRRKFRKLVRHAHAQSPYYRDLMDRAGISPETATLADFPVLTKTELMANFDAIVTDRTLTKQRITEFLNKSQDPGELLDDRYAVIHTSGSSGRVGYFVYSVPELARGVASSIRIRGVNIRKSGAFIGATQGHFAGVTMSKTARWIKLSFSDFSFLDIHLPLTQMVQVLNEQQPQIVVGYAFILKILAQEQLAGRLRIKPEILQSSGEPLFEDDAELIRRVFAAPIANVYACSEHLFMGFALNDQPMHLMEDKLCFEYLSDGVLVTNLYNYTLPLIRYKMEDRLRPLRSFNGPFQHIAPVEGRHEQVPHFINADGEKDFVDPLTLVEYFCEGVKAFQFILTSDTSIRLHTVLESVNQEHIPAIVQKSGRRIAAHPRSKEYEQRGGGRASGRRNQTRSPHGKIQVDRKSTLTGRIAGSACSRRTAVMTR